VRRDLPNPRAADPEIDREIRQLREDIES